MPFEVASKLARQRDRSGTPCLIPPPSGHDPNGTNYQPQLTPRLRGGLTSAQIQVSQSSTWFAVPHLGRQSSLASPARLTSEGPSGSPNSRATQLPAPSATQAQGTLARGNLALATAVRHLRTPFERVSCGLKRASELRLRPLSSLQPWRTMTRGQIGPGLHPPAYYGFNRGRGGRIARQSRPRTTSCEYLRPP